MNRPSRRFFVHKIDLYVGTTERTDATGSLSVLRTLSAEAIRCLVTDKGGSRVPAFDGPIERKKVRVLFADTVDLREGHYLKYTTQAGKVRWFIVDSFRDDQDLGRLWVAECFETPDPKSGQS